MPTRPNTFHPPKITLQIVKRAWFAHDGRAYPVLRSSANVFKAAVLSKASAWEFHETYGPVLAQHEMDVYDRWWLLNCLADGNRAIRLYDSREAAERAALGR